MITNKSVEEMLSEIANQALLLRAALASHRGVLVQLGVASSYVDRVLTLAEFVGFCDGAQAAIRGEVQARAQIYTARMEGHVHG